MCRFIIIPVQAAVISLHSMYRLKNERRSGVMYYNEGEDQQYVPKKKPYNEACDLGHDFDMADDEARAEAAREAEARARAEEAIARAEEARARAAEAARATAEAKVKAAKLAAKAKCKKRHKKEKKQDCKRKHKKKK